MVTSYSIEQFPKNKNIENLSDEQNQIRKNKKKYSYESEFVCVKCFKKQAISEFYIKDKSTGRRSRSCRDCQMKADNVVEIGKCRFAKKILGKGFRRCSVCKDIKPIKDFAKSKKSFGGHLHNCNVCSYNLSRKFIVSQRKSIGLFHVKQYGKKKYGYTNFNEETVTKLRNEIIEKAKPKYFIDGQEFVTIVDFARYIEMKYGNAITTTLKRISDGKTEEQCKLTEREARSIAYTQGRIRVTDTVTGEAFEFNNTTDERLVKMFSSSAITKGVKTGEKTRITKLSKYKNPCIITRVK